MGRRTSKVKVPDPFIEIIDQMKQDLNRRMKDTGAKKQFSRQDIMRKLGKEIKTNPEIQDGVLKIKTRGKKAFRL